MHFESEVWTWHRAGVRINETPPPWCYITQPHQNFPLSTRCSVDLYQTLKKADLENTDFENVVYVLLEKP